MRAVIQRVSSASVLINEEHLENINRGFLIFLGIENDDSLVDIEWLIKKIIGLRIFSDNDGKMNLNLEQINGQILVISQFTLHASCKKGNRPSFIKAASNDIAVPLYNTFIEKLRHQNRRVKTGEFGANMKVTLTNDGPVTILLDSKNKE